MKYETKQSDFSFLTLIVMTLLVPILIAFCIYANPISWAANILTGAQALKDLENDLVEAIELHNENAKLYNFTLDLIMEVAEEIGTLETERSNAWENYYNAIDSAKAAKKEMKRILKEIANVPLKILKSCLCGVTTTFNAILK